MNATEAFTYLGAGVGLQAAVFALFYWFWRRLSLLASIALLLGGVAALVLAQPLFDSWAPRLAALLWVEPRTPPEIGSWTEACTVADASLLDRRTPMRLPKEGWSEVWLTSQERPSLLRMPGCQRIPVSLPQPYLINQVVPGGLALLRRDEVNAGKMTYEWQLLNAQTGSLNPVPSPATDVGAYLSDDGSQTAWILRDDQPGLPVREILHLLPVRSGAEQTLDLTPFCPHSCEIVGVDSKAGEILLFASPPAKLLAVSLDGSERAAPALPPGVEPFSGSIASTDHGVLAWDPHILAWSMDTGTGSHRVPRGSALIAAAADPSGRYVAVSTSRRQGLGHLQFAVVVLRTSDGSEVFKRFLTEYCMAVAFIGRDYFAYSDGGTTHVFEVS